MLFVIEVVVIVFKFGFVIICVFVELFDFDVLLGLIVILLFLVESSILFVIGKEVEFCVK